ncbi:MAG TPA: alpha/beta hydrolase [Kofleriaceae bacterium]
MSNVIANHIDLHVQEIGSGSPVVMLHGLLIGSLAAWYLTAAPALAASHRVVTFDLRGHGRSAVPPDGYGVASMARDLGGLVDALDLPPVDLVGHSWGGLVALRFALDHPARVRRLAIVEAPLPPSRMTELGAFTQASPETWVAALPETLRAAVASGGRQARKLLASLERLATQTTLLADLRAEPDIPDADLAHLVPETLLLYGTRSSCAPVGERLARAIPHARLAMLDGGHYLHLEARAALTAELVAFLGADRG